MQECWAQQPTSRPRFLDIEIRLDSLKPEEVYSQAWAMRVRQRSGGNNGGLANFFPPALAAEIEQGKKVPPQQLERVSIFFSDVVGFTALSGRMEASRVVYLHFHSDFMS
jgi:class 3 adenylate cyclase